MLEKRTKYDNWLTPIHMLEYTVLLSCVISQNHSADMMDRAILNAVVFRP